MLKFIVRRFGWIWMVLGGLEWIWVDLGGFRWTVAVAVAVAVGNSN